MQQTHSGLRRGPRCEAARARAWLAATVCVLLLWGPRVGRGAGAPKPAEPSPPAELVLHLPLDGSLADASGHGHRFKGCYGKKPELRWVPGHEGQALALDGRTAVVSTASPVLLPGRASWTVECRLKPSPEMKRGNATVLGGLYVRGRWYGIVLRKPGVLLGHFDAGGEAVGVSRSENVAASLFDGRWHGVAAVRDMRRGGEIRLYVDGRDVTAVRGYQPWPIDVEGREMCAMVGSFAPWTMAKQSYQGLIDEVKIFRGLPRAYAAAADAPAPPPPPDLSKDPLAEVSPEDPASQAALRLRPQTTLIAVPRPAPYASEDAAAKLLQKHLRRACGVKGGFETACWGQKTAGRFARAGAILAVGHTRWRAKRDVAKLAAHGFAIRRKKNVVVLSGATPQATLWAAAAFLDRFCGVRFYMPGELFTSAPRAREVTLGKVDIRTQPYVKAGMMTGLHGPGGSEWGKLNAVCRRHDTHQHNLYRMFPPQRFAVSHPEIYPVLGGKRFIPTPKNARGQLCFSEPKLVDLACEVAAEYFAARPRAPFIAFSVMDTSAFCQCDRCRRLLREHGKKEGQRGGVEINPTGYSYIYWSFMNAVARRLEKRFPHKRIVGLAYSQVRKPPPFELHRNLVAWHVWKMADIVVDKRFVFDAGGKLVAEKTQPQTLRWCKIAAHTGHHDWAHGKGFLIPRTYTHHVQQTFRALEQLGAPIEFTHAEAYPNWGLDGPKLYLIGRLWWDPAADVDALLKQFCDDLFGAAAEVMRDYFTDLETLYTQMNDRAERKLYRFRRGQYGEQFALTAGERELVRRCRGHLDRAAKLAKEQKAAQRIALFSKTFRLSEYLFEIRGASPASASKVEEARRYARTTIAPDAMTVYRTGKDELLRRIDRALRDAAAATD